MMSEDGGPLGEHDRFDSGIAEKVSTRCGNANVIIGEIKFGFMRQPGVGVSKASRIMCSQMTAIEDTASPGTPISLTAACAAAVYCECGDGVGSKRVGREDFTGRLSAVFLFGTLPQPHH